VRKTKLKSLYWPNPVKIYVDLYLKSNIEQTKRDFNSLSDVYAFKFNGSSKFYVYGSINLTIRIWAHLSNRNYNVYLQNAFNKHGLNNFTLAII